MELLVKLKENNLLKDFLYIGGGFTNGYPVSSEIDFLRKNFRMKGKVPLVIHRSHYAGDELNLNYAFRADISSRDAAMMLNPGGIDFDSTNLNLHEQSQETNFHFSFESFRNVRPDAVNGIQPVITGIIPVANFSLLIGALQ